MVHHLATFRPFSRDPVPRKEIKLRRNFSNSLGVVMVSKCRRALVTGSARAAVSPHGTRLSKASSLAFHLPALIQSRMRPIRPLYSKDSTFDVHLPTPRALLRPPQGSKLLGFAGVCSCLTAFSQRQLDDWKYIENSGLCCSGSFNKSVRCSVQTNQRMSSSQSRRFRSWSLGCTY